MTPIKKVASGSSGGNGISVDQSDSTPRSNTSDSSLSRLIRDLAATPVPHKTSTPQKSPYSDNPLSSSQSKTAISTPPSLQDMRTEGKGHYEVADDSEIVLSDSDLSIQRCMMNLIRGNADGLPQLPLLNRRGTNSYIWLISIQIASLIISIHILLYLVVGIHFSNCIDNICIRNLINICI